MTRKNFATFLKELKSSKNWDELKQKADEFKSAIEENIENFSHDNMLTYHNHYKNHHCNPDKKINEGVFYYCKNKNTGLMNVF